MTGIIIPHVYGYTATFEDGTQIVHEHTVEDGDKSKIFENKTLFTDIQFKSGDLKEDNPLFEGKPELFTEMMENKVPLISFVIHSDEQMVGVDLRDGHFEINGIPFWQHRQDMLQYKDFRVIYYRTVSHNMDANNNYNNSEIICYAIGWQTTNAKGENVQSVVLV